MSLVCPFPSPQEFEFARELHDSVPASPASAVAYHHINPGADLDSNTDPKIRLRAGALSTGRQNVPVPQGNSDADEFTYANTRSASGTSVLASQSASIPSPSLSQMAASTACTESKSHPLHTFTVPTLCPSCCVLRESNLARFEARAIKESVDREGRPGGGGNRGRIVDFWAERKKISSSKAGPGRGKLIPLICVEEGRWRAESNDAHDDDKGEPEVSCADPADAEGPGKDAAGVDVDVHAMDLAAYEMRNTVAIAAAATALPGRSWWSWKSNSAPLRPGAGTAADASARQSENPVGTSQEADAATLTDSMLGEDGAARSGTAFGKRSRRVDLAGVDETWRGIDNDVRCDTVGRNARGMERILGWNIKGVARGDGLTLT